MNPEPPKLDLSNLPFEPEPGIRPPGMDEFFATLGLDIQKHGWIIHSIADSAIDVDYAYTIGLIERGCQAEIMIANMPLSLATGYLNEIAVDMTTGIGVPPGTWPYGHGSPLGPPLQGVMHMSRPGSGVTLNVARAYYQVPSLMVAQYVWPDWDGNYPWDEGWTSDVSQPTPLRRKGSRIEG